MKFTSIRLFLALVFACIPLSAQTRRFAYVVNEGSNAVSVYAVDRVTGALTQVSLAATGSIPSSIAVDPAGHFAFVANSAETSGVPSISVYTIEPNTGALTQIPGSAFPTGLKPNGIAMHPSGKFLYSTGYPGAILAFSINVSTGALTPVAGSPYPDTLYAWSLTTDPGGKFLFVANADNANVPVYKIDQQTGALTPVPGSPFPAPGNGHFIDVVDPTGRFLYMSGNESQILGYSIDPTSGALATVAGSPFGAGSFTTGVAMDPLGRFVYATNQTSQNVSAYNINPSTGVLGAVPGSPFPAGNGAFVPAVDPTGSFLYVPNAYAANVSAYSIDHSTGALTPVPGSPFATGTLPVWVAIIDENPTTAVSVLPTQGGNVGTVTAQVFGSGFRSGTTLKLTGIGPDVLGTNTQVLDVGYLTTTFDLTGATPGVRNVVITNPDSTTATLTGGFTVEQGGAAQISVNIIGRNQIRIGTPQTFYVAVTNNGSVDSSPGLASLTGPSSIGYTQSNGGDLFTAGQTPLLLSPSALDSVTSNVAVSSSSTNNSILFATSSVPAGATQFATMQLFDVNVSNFTVTSQWQAEQYPSSFDDYLSEHGIAYYPTVALQAAFLPPQCNAPLQTVTDAYNQASNNYRMFQAAWQEAIGDLALLPASAAKAGFEATAVESAGLSYLGTILLSALVSEVDSCVSNYFGDATNQGCLSSLKTNLKTAADAGAAALQNPTLLTVAARRAVGDFVTAAGAALDRMDAVGDLNNAIGTEQLMFGTFRQQLGAYRNAFSNFEACVGGTPPAPTSQPGTSYLTLNGVSSLDPNDKFGPSGFRQSRFVSSGSALPYSVYFDNQPTATAPAQRVTITDTLNSNLDPTTVVPGPISFPNQVITPPSIPLSFAPFTTTVDLRPTTNLLVKINASLNTSTGLVIWTFQSLDPATNQPPTDPLAGFLPPGAEGSVFFTVRPKSTVSTGTVIQNTATVVFDVNPPINTPTWTNTIDNTSPTSRVNWLPATQATTSFTVSWAGSDVGAGVQDFTVYASDNGGAYTAVFQNVTTTSALFTGTAGHTYGFYTIARDLVGNVEGGKTAPEAITKIVADTTPPVIVPQITGTLGNNGWYRSNVTITWNVNDPESGIASSTGCTSTTLTSDTKGFTVTCSATNGAGLSASIPVTVKIDQTPPAISGMPAASCTLWPVTQKLVTIATVTATDALSGLAPGSFHVTGTSNQPIAPNDPMYPDIVITPDGKGGYVVQLRADRLGTSNIDRIYTLTATANDLAGNMASVTSTCTVLHDQGKN